MRRFGVLVLGLALLWSLLYPNPVEASKANTGKRLNIQIKVTTDSVTLSWKGIADHYEVISLGKKGRKLWSGSKTSYTHKGLEPDEGQGYKVIAYDRQKKQVTEVKINTSTLKTKAQKQEELRSMKESYKRMEQPAFPPSYPMIEARIDTIVEGEEIKIIWHNLPDEDGIYEIYRDHKFLKKVKGNTFIDREPLDGPRSYRVIGKKRPPQWRIDQAKAYLKKQKIKIPLDNEEKLFYETSDLGIIMNIDELAADRVERITKEKEKRKVKGTSQKKKPDLQKLSTANVPLLSHLTWLPLRSTTKNNVKSP